MLSKRIYYVVLTLVLVGSLGIWLSPSMARTWGEFFQQWSGTADSVDANNSRGGERWTASTPNAGSNTEQRSGVKNRKMAMTVGINTYPDFSGLRPLNYARADAEALAEALRGAGYVVRVLADGNATKGSILDTIRIINENSDPEEGTVIFAFAGHGFQDKDGAKRNYLATYETSARDIRNTGLAVDDVATALATNGAPRRMLLIDACRNDPTPNNRGFTTGSASFAPSGLFKGAEGTRILFSTKAGDFSWERPELGHGVFTHFLVEGIKGKAADAQGLVTFRGLADYVQSQVFNWGFEHGNQQQPYDAGEGSGWFLVAQTTPPVLPAVPPVVVPSVVPAPVVTQVPVVTPQPPPAARLAFEPEMVSIPAGSFMMGSPKSEKGRYDDEGPQHRVQVAAFKLGKYEVTRGQFAAFVQDTDYKTEAEADGKGCYSWDGNAWVQKPEFTWRNPGFSQTDAHPVVCVSWNDSQRYLEWLSNKTGKDYRLPTEAQWEYAARAGSTSRYFFGDDANRLGDYAWYYDNSNSKTHPVGEKLPNAWGLYDVHGNVWEWTQDRWHGDYNGAPTDGSAWESGDSLKSLSLEPERIELHEVAITDTKRVPAIINAMAETIRRIGLSPFKF